MVGDGAQAAGDLPPDLGDLLGEDGQLQAAARVHGVPPPQAGWEVEVLLPSPSRLCSSGTNSDRLSTRPFQSQAVQWAAIPLLVERNMVTGLLVTGQTGGPHSQAVPGYTTRRRAFQKRFDPLRQNIIIIQKRRLVWESRLVLWEGRSGGCGHYGHIQRLPQVRLDNNCVF